MSQPPRDPYARYRPQDYPPGQTEPVMQPPPPSFTANPNYMPPQQPGGPGWGPPPPPQPPKKKKHRARNVLLGLVGLFVILIVIGVAAGGSHNTASSTSASSSPAASTPAKPAPTTAAPTTPAAPAMSTSEQQAVDSAQNYLSMGKGFSQAGLFQQLTSSAGEGFTAADATFAINYLKPDWNAQAVESAKGYLAMGGFSRSGLIEQLTSSAGEGFTEAQAEYAVAQVGL
jgi:Host cell surface-exposed lipoprotein